VDKLIPEKKKIDFYSNYTEYLFKQLKQSKKTIGKYNQIIKTKMNEAIERD